VALRSFSSGSRHRVFLPDYPWRCLWRGFRQMILTTPLRRTTLQLSQILLTDALTFTALTCLTAKEKNDPRSEYPRD